MIGTDTNSRPVARTLAGVTSQRRVKAAESDPTSSPGLRRAKFRAVRGMQHSAAQPAALAVAGAGLVFVLSSPEYPRLVVFPLIGLVLSLYPLACFIQTRQARHIPVFIISTANWLYFVAPFLYSQLPRGDGRRIIPTEYLTELALYPTLSIAAFILAYYFLPSTSKRIFESGLRLSGAKLQMWSIWMCVAGSCYFLIKVLFPSVVEPLGRVVAILDNLTLFGCVLALVSYFRDGFRPGVFFYACGALLLQIMVIISSTLLARVVYIGVCLLMPVFLKRRQIPWKTGLVVLVVFLPVFANRVSHRTEMGLEDAIKKERGLPAKIEQAFEIISSDYANWSFGYTMDAISYTLSNRLENVTFLGQCVSLHTRGRPFMHGETMTGIFYSLIPRFLYPNKPLQDHGTVLSAEYGFKDPGTAVSINFPWLVDFYINFGFYGMVIGSFAMGAFFRWACSLVAFGNGDLGLLAFCDILFWMLCAENNISMIVGGTLQSLVVWWIISRIVKSYAKPTRAH